MGPMLCRHTAKQFCLELIDQRLRFVEHTAPARHRRLDAQPEADATTLQVGEASDEQRAGLALCIRDGHPLGAGTGRYDELYEKWIGGDIPSLLVPNAYR